MSGRIVTGVAALAATFALAAGTGTAEAANIATVTGMTVPTTGQTQAGRLVRDAVPSTCASPKTNPAVLSASQSFRYRNHTLASVLREPVCVTVTLSTSCTGSNEIFSASYGTFVPSDPTANYLADLGTSPPGATSYSFTVGAEGRWGTVVHEVVSGAGCSGYTITFASRGPWATSRPAITGSAALGSVLTATDAVWREAPSVQRRWMRCSAAACAEILGATGPTYTVSADDLGSTLRVRSTATDADGTTSTESASVQPYIPIRTLTEQSLTIGDRVHLGLLIRNGAESRCDAPTETPSIVQPAATRLFDVQSVSSILDDPVCLVVETTPACGGGVTPAIYSPVFEPGSLTTNYRANSGRSPSSPNLAAWSLPAGGTAEVEVSQGSSGSDCLSYRLEIGADAPFASALPAISGTPAEGAALTTSDGSWSGSPAFTRVWLRCDAAGSACAAIDGADATTFTPSAADVGRRLRVRTTATQGRSASATSAPTEPVVAAPPRPPGGPPDDGADRTAPTVTLRLPRTALRTARRRGVIPVLATCDEACTLALRGQVPRRAAKRLGRARFAKGRRTALGGRRVTVRLKLTKKARAALRRRRSLAFTIRGTASDAAGNTRALARTAKLRRPRRRA